MTSQELREKFLKFFEKNDHVIIPSAPLIPSEEEQLAGKEKVLFTSAGMQPLIPYLMGKVHSKGKRLADVQKCLRTDDIEQVGDEFHHTFFEMLGNWSLGEYWKDEAIRLSFEFLTKELEIPVSKLAVTVFAGDSDAPKDEESAKEWEKQGIPKDRIFYFGKEYNWWPTGEKSGPCGPDTEMFYWTGDGNPEGKPNENPLWVEIWNDVFMQFNRKEDGSLEDLPQKNVDTGMGLERTLAVLNGKDNDYETDLFLPIIEEIRKSRNNYSEKSERIIADHLRAAVFLIADGMNPNPKDSRGSVVHRLIRDAIIQEGKQLEGNILTRIIDIIVSGYKQQYPELIDQQEVIKKAINETYEAILSSGESEWRVKKLAEEIRREKEEIYSNPVVGTAPISLASTYAGQIGFQYHQTWGTSLGTTINVIKQQELDPDIARKAYDEEFKKHQLTSRWIPTRKFVGGLAGHSETEIKYHTATHLLHQALRDVLGPTVYQKGSNITSERLRFDFSFDRKMTDAEIKQAEDLVNKKIEEDLKVDHMIVSLSEAKQMNAIGLFDEKYTDKVSLYGVGPKYSLDPNTKDTRGRGGYYSLEFCGGPHVKHSGIIGKIKITKEEAVSSGIRRIRAEIVLR